MDYYLLTDLAVTMGYHLAMSGAETFRVEDTVHRILRAYGVECEVFAIPNSISISLEAANGKPLMLMKRIDFHGNDLETMEKLNALSRRICTERPEVDEAMTWLHETLAACRTYRTGVIYLGGVLVGLGFCLVFGGTLLDCLWAGLMGLIIGLVTRFMDKQEANPFFSTLLAACCMAEKKQVIEVHFDRREKIHSKARLTLFAVLFLVSLLAVLHVISSHTALGITVALMLLCARDVLKKVDYWLLATFVCFFIFAGNIGEIGAVKSFLEGALQQNTMLGAVLSSQIISNVPAAVLLSHFTGAWQPLLVGVNIGGAGTLVGSLASLITLQHFTSVRKIFPRATALPELSTGRFLALFSVLNFGFLAILLIACGTASSF